jgi:HopA1 effector protein family
MTTADPRLTAELERIFAAIEIAHPQAFAFAGRAMPVTPPAAPAVGQQPNALVFQLQQTLYQHCYCQRFSGRLPDAPPSSPPDARLLETLRAANQGRERWDVGWQIEHVLQSGQIVARKGSCRRSVWPGEFVSHGGPGVAPQPGAAISVRAAVDSTTYQPGFYFVFGDTLSDDQDNYGILRLYWNAREPGAAALVREISATLNEYLVPFRFKILSHSGFFHRADAAVLYVNKRYWRVVVEVLRAPYERLGDGLAPQTPLFTKELAPGLGLAEDPGGAESFGMHRCRLVAEAVWDAYTAGAQTVGARMAEVDRHFARAGLALARPYLNPRSRDCYDAMVPARP